MPEATTRADNTLDAQQTDNDGPSSPLQLLKAVKEVQERRIAVWREYEDAFDTFLSQSASSVSAPVNGSQNDAPPPHIEGEESGRCAGCSTTTVPLSERLLAQIMQITTQALIECGHRLRAIQTELAHSITPQLATLVDSIQSKENTLLRTIVSRDQLRKTTIKPVDTPTETQTDHQAIQTIAALDTEVQATRAEITELMQEIYAESLELQLADG